MNKLIVEIHQLDHDVSYGGTVVLTPTDFPGQGIYVWEKDLYFVNDSFVTIHMLDDPHWLEVFCAVDKPSNALQNSVSESFILKLIAVSQNPALAESLALEK